MTYWSQETVYIVYQRFIYVGPETLVYYRLIYVGIVGSVVEEVFGRLP